MLMGSARSGLLTPQLRSCFDWRRRCYQAAGPRIVRCHRSHSPVRLFTDGAYERGIVTVGAVLFSDQLRRSQYWGVRVPEEVAAHWKELIHGGQVIGQAELLRSALARETWATALRGASAVQYLDNSSAEMALVKGYSPSPASAPLVSRVADADVRLGVRSWFGRVPSLSNPADAPSRLDFASREAEGWELCPPVVGAWPPPTEAWASA